jgi:dTDP-4-dehydrorhamnose reductase
MKIVIFGRTGMLGNYIYNYLSGDFEVSSIDRNNYDILKNDFVDLEKIFMELKTDIIINCAGLIPQVIKEESKNIMYYKINSEFPKYLSILCERYKIKLIHITTDCVFSGKRGNYTEFDKSDEVNIYGMSKSFGENIGGTIIRTSIIGHQIKFDGYSLLEWVLKNNNKKINGYTNHYWNGMTCLELAKIIKNIIKNKNYWDGVRHFYSNSVSKYELLCLIKDIYNLNIDIVPYKCDIEVNKTLKSVYNIDYKIPSLFQQIIEMKNYKFKFI